MKIAVWSTSKFIGIHYFTCCRHYNGYEYNPQKFEKYSCMNNFEMDNLILSIAQRYYNLPVFIYLQCDMHYASRKHWKVHFAQ